MKDVIQKEEVDKMNRYGKIYTIMLIVTVVSAVPLFMWLGLWAFISKDIVSCRQCAYSFLCLYINRFVDACVFKLVSYSK